MKPADYVILFVIAALTALALRYLYKCRKKGKCCGCSGCSSCHSSCCKKKN